MCQKRSIFIGITDYFVKFNLGKKVGERFQASARFCGDGWTPIAGTIVYELNGGPGDHGKMIFVKPDKGQTYSSHLCARWSTIPIWLSECGQSGILCPDKHPDVREMMNTLEWYEEMEQGLLSHRREREAVNCLAL